MEWEQLDTTGDVLGRNGEEDVVDGVREVECFLLNEELLGFDGAAARCKAVMKQDEGGSDARDAVLAAVATQTQNDIVVCVCVCVRIRARVSEREKEREREGGMDTRMEGGGESVRVRAGVHTCMRAFEQRIRNPPPCARWCAELAYSHQLAQ